MRIWEVSNLREYEIFLRGREISEQLVTHFMRLFKDDWDGIYFGSPTDLLYLERWVTIARSLSDLLNKDLTVAEIRRVLEKLQDIEEQIMAEEEGEL